MFFYTYLPITQIKVEDILSSSVDNLVLCHQSPHHPRRTPVLISTIVDCIFLSTSWLIHLTGIPQDALLCIWFLSGTDMPVRFLHLLGSKTLSFFTALYYSIV